MFERALTLGLVLAVLVGGGVYVASKLSGHDKTVSAADRRLIERAVAHREPGTVTSTTCNSAGCTIWVRKRATHRCDGWQGTVSGDGQVSLVGVGHKAC